MILLITFIGFHLLADYTLQGWLAQGKQLSWWKNLGLTNEQFKKYQYDYICALICHSLYWSIVTFLPVLWLNVNEWIIISIIIVNTIIHAIIDDLKANRFKLNLWQDQVLHLIQIVITWIIVVNL